MYVVLIAVFLVNEVVVTCWWHLYFYYTAYFTIGKALQLIKYKTNARFLKLHPIIIWKMIWLLSKMCLKIFFLSPLPLSFSIQYCLQSGWLGRVTERIESIKFHSDIEETSGVYKNFSKPYTKFCQRKKESNKIMVLFQQKVWLIKGWREAWDVHDCYLQPHNLSDGQY